MKRLSILLLLLIFCHCIYAQHAVYKKWDARFGGINDDELSDLHQTKDGGFILAGSSSSDISGNKTETCQGFEDYWIVKIDATGHYVWDKRYGGNSLDDLGSIYATKDMGYILIGTSGSDISGDITQPSRGGFDYWVVKVDSVGTKQWDKRYGGSGDDFGLAVLQTRDGGYILGGNSSSGISGDKSQSNWDPSYSTEDYWVVKIDSVGNKIWDKRFGGTKEDGCNDIIETPDGGYLIGGTASSDSSGDKTQQNTVPFETNYWVVKIDGNGNKQWDKRFGGTYFENFSKALNTIDGNYMLGGTSGSSSIGYDKSMANCGYWLVKIDTSGNKVGDWAYGTGTDCGQGFGTMTNTFDGGYVLTGVSGNMVGGDKLSPNLGNVQVWTIKIDSQMHRVWDKTALTASFRYTDHSVGAFETSTGGCYVVGVVTTAGIGGEKTQPNWEPHDSLFDYWVVSYCDTTLTSITEAIGNIHFSIYPNPTSNEVSINIEKDDLKEASFTLTNTNSQIIYKSSETNLAPSYTKILDLSRLPSGIYILEMIVDGKLITRKILKE